MNAGYSMAISGAVVLIGLIVLFGVPYLIGKAVKSKADNATAIHAKVRSVMTPANITGNYQAVVFEFDNGERVNLLVGDCTLTEGDAGMLRYYKKTLGSFVKDKA